MLFKGLLEIDGEPGVVGVEGLDSTAFDSTADDGDEGLPALETMTDVVVVGVESLGETADDGDEGLPAVETTTAVVVVGAANAGVASTSPQAKAVMELLR